MASLGPEALSDEFSAMVADTTTTRQLNTWLRDQRVVAGIGRGWSDDILLRAGLSPFAPLRSLSVEQRAALDAAVREVLGAALELERTRTDGLSDAKLGGRFAVHNRAGEPCPRCGTTLQRVSFESHEITYCPACQTRGRILADRRMSKLLR
jgi:formamidopyrimidine-DNA glycosylase